MSASLAFKHNDAPLLACTVSRNVEDFNLLIEDMEAQLGEAWGDLTFDEAIHYLNQEEAAALQFIAIAVDKSDEESIEKITTVIRAAKEIDLKVILIADGLGPMALHELLREGADDFVPYPLPEDALAEAIERIRKKQEKEIAAEQHLTHKKVPISRPSGQLSSSGNVIAIHGLGGGVGATSFAVNLAWELTTLDTEHCPKVCILDLDLQFGSVATYTDLQRKPFIHELLMDVPSLDLQAFNEALQPYKDKIYIFTAPTEILPLDIISPEDVKTLISMAKEKFDFVIIDMPTAITSWTDTVLSESDRYYALVELELRAAQNLLRLQQTLRSEGLPLDRISYVLNRAPRDISGKSRIKRMSDTLNIMFNAVLADCSKMLTEANDQALPLVEIYPKHPYRKEVQKLAIEIWRQVSGEEIFGKSTSSRSIFSFG